MNQKSRDMVLRKLMLLVFFSPKKYATVAQNSKKYFKPAYNIKAAGLSNIEKYSPEKDDI